jgi:tRNA threonylcarbamoyladenosine biosynthesis protein TsaB
VALLRGEELLAEVEAPAQRSAAETLLPSVDAALREAGVPLAAVEAFAVSVGPGSFTGLRIGVATIKGLAFGSAAPVAPVSTLAALARGAAGPGPRGAALVALLDARRGELYAAGWRIEGAERAAVACAPREGVYTPEELAALLPPGALLVGEGAALHGERIRGLAGGRVELGPAQPPRARDVAALGLRALAEGLGVSAEELVPRYVRRAEAEVRRTGLRFE